MEPLVRYPDWRERFERTIKEKMSKPFQWGEHDCCIVTFDLVAAITGLQLFPHRGQYDTLDSMLKLSEEVYGVAHSPESFTNHVLGESQPTGLANTGDIVCFEKDEHNSIGTLTSMGAMFCGFDGMLFVPLPRCKCSWRVG